MPQLFVNRLTVIDCSYLDPQRGLVGESWQVDIILHGGLDDQGMVLDFGDVKKSVKHLIDTHFDHKLLAPARYPGLVSQTEDDHLMIDFTLRSGAQIQHKSPPDAVNLVDVASITADTLPAPIINTLMPHMPANVSGIEIRLWPETTDSAFYHYSHGLKQHAGNCQRIAHGHRSQLVIERNGQRDGELEQQWAKQWADIYIGTREDLRAQDDEQMHFAYHSQQGDFALSVPTAACYLIDTDSTVENLAQHIADALKQQHPSDTFRVFAFEGVDKGAIGQA